METAVNDALDGRLFWSYIFAALLLQNLAAAGIWWWLPARLDKPMVLETDAAQAAMILSSFRLTASARRSSCAIRALRSKTARRASCARIWVSNAARMSSAPAVLAGNEAT